MGMASWSRQGALTEVGWKLVQLLLYLADILAHSSPYTLFYLSRSISVSTYVGKVLRAYICIGGAGNGVKMINQESNVTGGGQLDLKVSQGTPDTAALDAAAATNTIISSRFFDVSPMLLVKPELTPSTTPQHSAGKFEGARQEHQVGKKKNEMRYPDPIPARGTLSSYRLFSLCCHTVSPIGGAHA